MGGRSGQGMGRPAQAPLAGNGLGDQDLQEHSAGKSPLFPSHPILTSTGPSLPPGQGGGTEPRGHPRSISAVK